MQDLQTPLLRGSTGNPVFFGAYISPFVSPPDTFFVFTIVWSR